MSKKDMQPKDLASFYPTTVQTSIKALDIAHVTLPLLIVQFSNNAVCDILPPLVGLTVAGLGSQGFADVVAGEYMVGYTNTLEPSDIKGNLSQNASFWTPLLGATESNLVIANKSAVLNCVFDGVFEDVNGDLACAWLETDIAGKVNLKYSETGAVSPPATTPPPVSQAGLSEGLYINPNLAALQSLKGQNVPFSDIMIMDGKGSTFNTNLQDIPRNGLGMTFDNGAKSLRFSQTFRNPAVLKGRFLQIPDENGVALPMAGISVKIYKGQTFVPHAQFVSDVHGAFNLSVGLGTYFFEIEIDGKSFMYTQSLI